MNYSRGSRLILCLLAFLCLNPPTFAQTTTQVKASPETLNAYWIFLTPGKTAGTTDRAEREKRQKAHVGNFGRLFEAGKLLTAGPVADPQKKRRGIVVVKAPSVKALPELFEPDPLVKNGILELDAIKLETAVGAFQKDPSLTEMAEYRLVLLEKPTADDKELDAGEQTKNLAYLQSIHDAKRLCFAGWLVGDSQRRGVLIFRKLDEPSLKSLVDDIPAVKSKLWNPTTMPLYMSEGVVK